MPARPNLLWIVTTQWRAQARGGLDPDARTPGLDAFARAAVDFSEAVTPHPFGPFARAALLTGRPSPANGVRSYHDPLPEDAETVAHALGARGYHTAFFGKWHLAPRDPAAPLVGEAHARQVVPPPRRGGFGFWEGFEGGFLLNDPWLHGSRRPIPEQVAGYQADVICGLAAEWLADAPQPWFAVVSLETPHPPYAAPASGVASPPPASLHLRTNVPRGGAVEERARRELSGYHAHVTATDRAMARLWNGPAAADADVVVTSVHGDMHGSHGRFRKGWPYEESIRVPLLVRSPRRPGGRDRSAATLLDLPRWAVAAADGAAWPAPRARAAISMPSVVALPDQCDRPWQGWRTPDWKVVLGPGAVPWLAFDLQADPDECRNLVDEPGEAGRVAAWVAAGRE